MVTLLPWVQSILAVLLVSLILVQRANTDASGAFSSDGGTGMTLNKRGIEKTLHRATILVGVLFVISVFTHLFIG